MRLFAVAVALALAAGPRLARAADAPHDKSFAPTASCTGCHRMHNAPGASLTSVAGNPNLCASCHTASAAPGEEILFPWVSGDQAVPGDAGAHHRWDAATSNASAGAQPPLTTELQANTANGLQCSACHNTHTSNKAYATRPHVSVKLGVALARHAAKSGGDPTVGDPGGRLTVTVATGATPSAKGYLVQIVAGGAPGTATYRLSNDNGTSWWGCNGTSYVAYLASPSNACTTGANLSLNDGANVKIAFGGTGFLDGDGWRLYVSYPFLRVTNAADEMCLDCHRSMRQGWQSTRGMDAAFPADGATVFSHPVGEGLNANGEGLDVASPDAIADANGAPQSSGDGVATNDLELVGGKVSCSTCHRVHAADSNSLTDDPR